MRLSRRGTIETLEQRRLLHSAGIESMTPFNGQTNVDPNVAIQATFDFPADPLSVTVDTLQLRGPSGNLIPTSVSYDVPSRTATLVPAAPLPTISDFYNVTIVGGPAGVRDAVTGADLHQDITWSFATDTPVFTDSIVLSGLNFPTAIEFSTDPSDHRIFVAEKRGIVNVFDGLDDPDGPSIVLDIRTEVYNANDKGLLGLALHPNFPTVPYFYVLYTYDAPWNNAVAAPAWGQAGANGDPPNTDGVGPSTSGRLERIEIDAQNNIVGRTELIHDWPVQSGTHSIGSMAFGADGALYVSGGDGAMPNFADFGQADYLLGATAIGDPPNQGGALRSQDLWSRHLGTPLPDDPVHLNGSIIRIDPLDGSPLAGNPLYGDSDVNAERIVGYGLRNPFRITTKPGTNEVWIGDVGWGQWEEINVLRDAVDTTIDNFGWPAYEGREPNATFDGLNLPLLEDLYADPNAHTQPYFTYQHGQPLYAGGPDTLSSISGLAFTQGDVLPRAFDGALFFSDFSGNYIGVMFEGLEEDPNAESIIDVNVNASFPVELQFGPDGELYYVDIGFGAIHRLRFTGINQPPVVVAEASPAFGVAIDEQNPLTVQFDAAGSFDPNPGDVLSFDWDLDGNGSFGDATTAQPSYPYTTTGIVHVGLRVSDNLGATSQTSLIVGVNETPPTVSIDSVTPATPWAVGDLISFSASATDLEDPPANISFEWEVILKHCPGICHSHPVTTLSGPAHSIVAPEHESPSHLELRVTATDSSGLSDTASIEIYPDTVALTFQSTPSGLSVAFNGEVNTTPFVAEAVLGSQQNTISALEPQTLNGAVYEFASWSVGGPRTQSLTATADQTLTAAFVLTNYLPQAADDSASTGEDAPLVIDVLGNDSDQDPADLLRVVAVTESAQGASVTINPDGTITYDPRNAWAYLLVGETGADFFHYTIDDGHGGTDTGRVTLTIQGTSNEDIVTDLQAYINFENGTAADVAPFGTVLDNGQLQGAATIVADGVGSHALQFSGPGDRLVIPTSFDINRGTRTAHTVSLWFYPENEAASGRQLIYEQGGFTKGANIYLEDGVLKGGFWNDDGTANAWPGTWITTATPVSRAWHHVAIVLDAVNCQADMYLDGVAVGGGFGAALNFHNNPSVGAADVNGTRYSDGAGGYQNSTSLNSFSGVVDELRTYNRALTASEIGVLFQVTRDIVGPALNLPSDIIVSTDPGRPDAVVHYTVTFSDNLPHATSVQTAGLPDGARFPLGTTTNTFVVTDSFGNSHTDSFDVTVLDTESPTARASDFLLQLDATGQGTVLVGDIDNGSSDNVALASITLDVATFGIADVGPQTVTLTATDTSGNVATAAATVTVVDTVPPVVLTHDITVQLDINGHATIQPQEVDGGTHDAAGIASLVVWPNTFTGDDVGPQTVTLTATDGNGNQASATALVTVEGGGIMSNLVTYFDFEGDFADQAPFGATSDVGTPQGAATLVIGGIGSQALQLNGPGDVVSLNTSVDINSTAHATYSVSVWFYATNPGAAGRQVIYEQGGTQKGLDLYLANGLLYGGAWNTAQAWNGTWVSSAFTPNAWNHALLVLDAGAGEVRLHLNGGTPQVATGAKLLQGHNHGSIGGTELGTRFYDATTGFVDSTNQNSFQGQVDELRIYSRALTSLDALALSSMTPMAPPDIVSDLNTYLDFEHDFVDEAVLGASTDSGTANGSVTFVSYGIGDAAASFDGSGGFVSLPYSLDVNTGTRSAYSVSLWLYPQSVNGRQVIYEQGGTQRGVSVYLENGNVLGGAWDVTRGWNGTWVSGTIVPNRWNHVAFVLDAASSEVRLHLNGQAPVVGTGATEVTGHTAASIGASQAGARYFDAVQGYANSTLSNPFHGALDELRIYDRALSALDAQALASATPSSPPTNDITTKLVTWFDFEGDVVDEAILGLMDDSGTLVGDPAFTNAGLGTTALDFDGNGDYVTLPMSPDINSTARSVQTIALWFYARDLDGRQVVYEQGGTVRGMNIYLDNGTLYGGAWNDGASWSGTWLSAGSVVANAWNHVALILDTNAGRIRLSLNGGPPQVGAALTLAGHGSASLGASVAGTRYFHATNGFQNSTSLNAFHGLIDDLRIYSRVLADLDVVELSSRTLANP